jgi:hypothetical protein
MKRATILSTSAILVGAGAAVSGGIAVAATSGEDSPPENETSITGEALERASSAALAVVGEGSVTDTEIGDEESLYEVEVTRPDGSQVDVQLDASFDLVETIPDSDTGE